MYTGLDFSPSDPDENEVYSLDFSKDLIASETITGVDVEIGVVEGADTGLASRLSGSPSFDGSICSQRLVGLQPGVTYRLQFFATTDQGNVRSLWSHVACRELA